MLTKEQKKFRSEMKAIRKENPEYFNNLNKYQRGTSSMKNKAVFGVGLTGFILLIIRLFLFIGSIISPGIGITNEFEYQTVSKQEAGFVKRQVIEEISSILVIYNDYSAHSFEQPSEDYYNTLNEKKWYMLTS